MSEFVEITKTRFEYSLFFLVNSSLFIISNSTMLGTKRKTTEQNQPEAKSKKKMRQDPNEQAAPILGKLGWLGENEHVKIPQTEQKITIQGVEVHAQVVAGGLKLLQYEEVCDREEKYQEVKAHLQNQVEHRQEEVKHYKERGKS